MVKKILKKKILEESLTLNIDEMKEVEVKWIKEFDSGNPLIGYNIRTGLTYCMYGRTGSTFTEEHKIKISESRKGIEPWNKGKTITEEHKKKIGRSGEDNGMVR